MSVQPKSPLFELALHGPIEPWIQGLADLAGANAATELRIARVCAWIKRQDLVPVGHSTWASFRRERVEWSDSWTRDLLRLVESPLNKVKAAVCTGLLPLRVAVRAPLQVTGPEHEVDWLAAAVAGEEIASDEERPLRVCALYEDARVIQRARSLARLLLGRHATTVELDELILTAWRQQTPASQLIAEAQLIPPPPSWDEPLGWCDEADPATHLLGAWREPQSLPEAITRLETLQYMRRGAAITLGEAWERIVAEKLWAVAGYDNLDAFATQVLGRSARSMQRYRQLGRGLLLHPELREQIKTACLLPHGLDLHRTILTAQAAGYHRALPWAEVARRVGIAEMQRITRESRWEGRRILEPYEQAMSRTTDAVARPPAPEDEPLPPGRADGPLRVDPDLPEAARWFVEHVKIPAQRGFGVVKERDRYVCQNPRCRRRSLRNQAHHVVFRSLGGSDDPSNGLCVCRACHLRGIHTGAFQVFFEGDDLVWRYPDGVVRVFGARSAA